MFDRKANAFELGKGVSVPRKARMGNEPFENRKRFRLVVADDNRDFADSIAVLLSMSGHQVTVAYDGVCALRQIRTMRPHGAILDLRMPELDGYGVARALRAEGLGALTLIALSGLSEPSDRELAREHGFDYFLLKPVEPSELELVVSRIDGAL
jgi:CheY-like chemotaxis protein